MNLKYSMLKKLANEMNLPFDEIENLFNDLYPITSPDFLNEVIVSTSFAKTNMFPYWNEKQSFERRFILKHINEHFGDSPKGSDIKWIKNSHEFGTYCDMEYYFNYENQNHLDYFNKLESIDSIKIEKALTKAWNETQCKIIL